MGTGEIGVPALTWLLDRPEWKVLAVVAQPDKPVGRKQELRACAPKELALQRGVPVLQPARLRAPESVAEITALRPDLIVVMAYGQILPKSILELPRLGCLNLHASLLPRWRGAAPIQAAIEAGDNVTGMTVMYMAEGLDTGDILLMHETPIAATDTGGILHDRLATMAPAALAAALPQLVAGSAARTPQDESQANYAAKLSRENGRIDWTRTPEEIDRRIRAMNPWPAAHTFLPSSDGLRQLKIFADQPLPSEVSASAPGTILRADSQGLLVAAGRGAVLLTEIQLEGKRRMVAGEFLRGHHVPLGATLGAIES
jgi:methionyl-tRNA formyltransferase